MSNLGWPTATPEPTADHRRLGWVDATAAVSRETEDGAADVVAESELHGSPSTEESPGLMGTTSAPAYEWPAPEPNGAADTQESALSSETGPRVPAEPDVSARAASASGAGTTVEQQPAVAGGLRPGQTLRSEGLGAALRASAPAEPRSAVDGRAIGADIYFSTGTLDQQDHPGSGAGTGTDQVPDLDTRTSPDGNGEHTAEEAGVGTARDFRGDVAPPEGLSSLTADGGAPAMSAVELVVDEAVENLPADAPVPHESAGLGVGENHVDDRLASIPTAPAEAGAGVTTEVPTDTHHASVDDEHAVAENLRRRIQLTGRPFPKPLDSRVMTVANQKGGVGKTTTTVNVAAAMAQSGLKVLVIDLDPQGNASTALGIDHHAEVPSIYDVLVDGTPLLDVVQPCTTVDGLFCAPATIDLAGAEIELVSLVARESRLQKAIVAAAETGHEYDYILIDCPPSLGLLTVNAMVAATEVFIPIQCEYYALEGLSQLLKNIELVRSHLNPALHVSTILLTMYDGRTRLSAQVADEVREHFPEQVLRITVPRSVRVSEAPSFGETVMTYDPTSSGALAYLEAAGEIADRGAAGQV